MRDNVQDRLRHSSMSHYWEAYGESPRWEGQGSLDGKRVVVFGEQGMGDIIQFARYFRPLRALGCHLILHCPPTLRRLLAGLVDEFVGDSVPDHDCHVLSMSLPFLLGEMGTESGAYLGTPPLELDPEFAGCLKIGVAWEGNPHHADNPARSCPLRLFEGLADLPHVRLFVLQNRVHDRTLLEGCQDMPLYAVKLVDFLDTAALIGAMDLVVSVDTSVLHLSGAMGKRTLGLLPRWHDPRWRVGDWYASLGLLRQRTEGDWSGVFADLFRELGVSCRVPRVAPRKQSILLTGGIGDVIALETYLDGEVDTVYYATRARRGIEELLRSVGIGNRHVSLWEDFSEVFAFYSKIECGEVLPSLPEDWPGVTDWSISSKFQEVDDGRYAPHPSAFLARKLADVARFALPADYVVVVPQSDNDTRIAGRSFSPDDWRCVTEFLESRGTTGVVVNRGASAPPHRRLVDLTNATTMPEAVEVLKGASGYLGIDSSLSILSARLFDPSRLRVKSVNPHLYRWKPIYYGPRDDFSFLRETFL